MSAFTILAIALPIAGSFAAMWWLFATAPLGWEDADGFHAGEEPESEAARLRRIEKLER